MFYNSTYKGVIKMGPAVGRWNGVGDGDKGYKTKEMLFSKGTDVSYMIFLHLRSKKELINT